MADGRQMRGFGRFLTAFLSRVELSPTKSSEVPILKQSVIKNFSETLGDRETFSELAKSDAKSVFSNFVDELQLSSDAGKVFAGRSGQFVLQGDGLSFVLLQATGDDKKLLNQLIKLPEILSNVFQGVLPGGLQVEGIVEHVLYNLLVCQYVHLVAGSIQLSLEALSYRFAFAIFFLDRPSGLRKFIRGRYFLETDHSSRRCSYIALLQKY